MKNRDLLDSIESINALANFKQSVKTSFAISLNLKAVKDHMEIFTEQRKKLVEEHTEKDADDKPLPVYELALDKDGKNILGDDGEPVKKLDKDGQPIAVEGQVKLIDPKKFQKDFEELLDIDITGDLKVRKIKLTDLTGQIEPRHFTNLLWMILDDVYEPADRVAAKEAEDKAAKSEKKEDEKKTAEAAA